MSEHKAASLTSSLFARKGRASPSSLLISKLQSSAPEHHAADAAVDLHSQHEGVGLKRSALDLHGQAVRRRAEAPEAELPLLAFVEGKIAAAEAQKEPECELQPASGQATSVLEAAAGEAVDEPRPPASLLDRSARALHKANGRRPSEDTALVENETQPAAPDVDAEATVETATISGDSNVTAIVDAPPDDLSTAAAIDGAAEVPGKKADTPVLLDPETPGAPLGSEDSGGGEATTVTDAAKEMPASAPGDAGIAPPPVAPSEAPPEAREADAGEKDAPVAPPTAAPAAPAVATIGTPASRKVADLSERAARPGEFAAKAVRRPPPGVGGALPWRRAAVVALGLALGLGAYVLLTGRPAELPVEATAPVTSETPSDSASTAVSRQAPASTETAAKELAAPDTAVGGSAPAVALPEPSFDVIRIEPDGQSIIAGRAAPFSEWILLNNDSPIASIKADANGEWVVLPDASLVPGANAFSLVPKAERGRVAIPAPAQAAPEESVSEPEAIIAPRSDAGARTGADAQAGAPGFALPKPKPSVPASGSLSAYRVSADGNYQVQVASVRRGVDAERELLRLTTAYPRLLGRLELEVQEASVEGVGTFFRIRSGAMADLGDAREVCRRLEAEGQGCLVVRRSSPPPADQQALRPQ